MFATVLHNLKSPENVGSIVRTHVAFGGGPIVTVGPVNWRLDKRAKACARRSENLGSIEGVADDDALLSWCQAKAYQPVAIEIAEESEPLAGFPFPERPALIFGHEGVGLPTSLMERCSATVTVPQFGPVPCLNVAISCGIVLYELNRGRTVERPVVGDEYLVRPQERPEAQPER